MKNAPEDFNDLAADLAMTIADCIDHPDCPSGLADALREISDEVTNAFSLTVSEQLRAMASLTKSRNARTRTEAQKPVTANSGARAAALNGA